MYKRLGDTASDKIQILVYHLAPVMVSSTEFVLALL